MKNNGVYVPPSIQAGLPVYFAVDNCDFKNDTADGKSDLHGTAQIVHQQSSANVVSGKLQIDRNQNRSLNYDPFPAIQVCPKPKPKPKNEIYSQFTPKNKDTDLHRIWHCIWFLTNTLKPENSTNVTPTWAGYNSLITNVLPVTIYYGLSLYPAPPTDWSNFYTALKLCQNISTATYPGGKTIISLDLQLYSKAIQLQSRDEINRNFVFHPGELHIVFAFLYATGKYIQDSGINQTFIAAGLYGPATLNQILRGKHMISGMEDHIVMYLCLHEM